MDLIATKRFRYRGRALKPGDQFEATRQHGRVLEATGQASKPTVDLGTVRTPAPRIAAKAKPSMDDDQDGHVGGSRRQEPSAELTAARARYKDATGKRFFSGWDADELDRRTAWHLAANQSEAPAEPETEEAPSEPDATEQPEPGDTSPPSDPAD